MLFHHIFERDLFEIDNAKHLLPHELANTFVCTEDFWKLFSAKNQIVIGSRGSGKTALIKMLSHQHLSNMNHPEAIAIIKNKEYIGIYQHTDLDWVSGLKNKIWLSEQEEEFFFQWAMNLSSCVALIETLKSCLINYIKDIGDRIEVEAIIVRKLMSGWLDNEIGLTTLKGLSDHLEDMLLDKQAQENEKRAHTGKKYVTIGSKFGVNLFGPLKRGIKIANDELNLPETCIWLYCLDEAEFLDKHHHKIINTHLRASSGNLVLKITTMPYCHYTLDTNINVPLMIGDDVEYVYIDKDPIISNSSGGEKEFGFMLFSKRIKTMPQKYNNLTLSKLLGESVLLDKKTSEWDVTSKNMKLLLKHANQETIERAFNLSSSKQQFKDQISRKLHAALLLKDEVSSLRGRKELTAYSGDLMAIRCGDSNPRRLIRIFNKLLAEVKFGKLGDLQKIKKPILTKQTQNKVLEQFSNTTLERVQSESKVGPELYAMLKKIGSYMEDKLHADKIGTDQISSIEVGDHIDDKLAELIRSAVSIGLLYPNTNTSIEDIPIKIGKYRLAYVLAPKFRILPRKGKSVNIKTIMEYRRGNNGKQLSLLDRG